MSELIRIDFFSTRNDRSYTKAAMTLNSDGTATVAKEEKFDSDSDKVYTSEKQMSKETVDSIKNNIKETGLFAWRFLPDDGFTLREKSKLVFVFRDGSSFEVEDGKKVPDQIRGGFFNVRLEMTVKN